MTSLLRPLIPLLMLAPLLAMTSEAHAQSPARLILRFQPAPRAVRLASLIVPRACVRTGLRMVC